MTNKAYALPQRRTDIQGLRAVGALLVAIYHIWIGRVSGGVDVFFVVSGYLLIGSLARQLESTGKVDLLAFLTRLADRLLPASLLVVAVILVSGWLWLPQLHWDNTIEQLAASTLYVENWFLAFNAVDYLARDQLGSPVQHYWAMSAQVQALVLVALTLVVLGLLSALARKDVTRGKILTLLGVLFAASLAYSVVATARNQAFAYFDTFARIWEFAAGGLIALLLPRIRLRAGLRTLLGWLGLLAIVFCGIVLEVSTVFPGYAALWPVGAAALILVCGEGDPLRYGVGRLLGCRPLVWLGNISYSLYLWHWPILVAYLTLTYQTEAGLLSGTLVLLASILLAHLTTKLVDQKFTKKSAELRPFRTIFGSALAVGLIAVGAFSWNQYKNVLIEDELTATLTPDLYLGTKALTSTHFDPGTEPLYPGLLTAKRDRGELYRQGCGQSMEGMEVLNCTFGPATAENTVAVVGGSHSAHWVPALSKALDDFSNWKMKIYTKSACPFSSEPISDVPAYRGSCKAWNKQLLQDLLREKPDVVFTNATRTTYPSSPEDEHVPEGYRQQWLPLLDNGIPVVAIRDTPRFGFDVPECIDINGRTGQPCMLQRDRLLAPDNPALALPEAKALNLIDLSNRFCSETLCPPVIGNILVYPDQGHVTPAYMKTVGKALAEKLRPVLRGIEHGGEAGSPDG